MLAAFALLIAQKAELGPTLPPGASTEFYRAALEVERHLAAGDWRAASSGLEALPKAKFRIGWNPAGLPASERPQWILQRDAAVLRWCQMQNDLSIDFGATGDLEFAFVDSLPLDPASGLRPAARFAWQTSPRKLIVTLARLRGQELTLTNPHAMHNEVAYAIGAYLGVADGKLYSSVMTRTDLPIERRLDLFPSDALVATLNLAAIETLRSSVATKKPIVPTHPRVVIDPEAVDAGRLSQGESTDFSILLKNVGNGVLEYRIVPDCGCFALQGVGRLAPGADARVPIRMDSTMFGGEVKHRLIVVTNDPDRPVFVVPFEVFVTPRYRLVSGHPNVQLLAAPVETLYAYLFFPSGTPFKVQQVAMAGLPGTVRFEPWTGELADEFMREPAMKRTGYRFIVTLDAKRIVGRAGFSLRISTNDPVYKSLTLSQMVQKGIAALPSQVYFGEVTGPRSATLFLSRPGKPFAVTAVKAEPPAFQATLSNSGKLDEHKIEVKYMGGASPGDLMGVVTLSTDDPVQPKIQVPLLAAVR